MRSVICWRSLMSGRGSLLSCRTVARKPDSEHAALAGRALDVKLPTVRLHQPQRDRQPKPKSPWLGLLRLRCPEEALEDPLTDVLGHADAGIRDAEPDGLLVGPAARLDRAARRRIPNGVREQIAEHRLQAVAIRRRLAGLAGSHDQRDALLV